MAGPVTRQFSRSDYYLMAETGVLAPDERTELIDGRIFVLEPIGPWHATTVSLLVGAFAPIYERAAPWTQNPVVLGERSEPQPDFALVRPPLARYRDGHPTPSDVLLVVEVADTSRDHDRDRKQPLYAGAGIRESWVVDRQGDRIEVARDPGPDGYRTVRTLGRGEELTVLAVPGFTVPVEKILGPGGG
jgi:Uma2 family endonuclease